MNNLLVGCSVITEFGLVSLKIKQLESSMKEK